MTDKELIDFALTKSNATPMFKLKYFVGGAQLTPYAMLKQWLMELRARQESIDSIRIRLRKSEISVKQEEEKLEFAATDLQKEIIQLEMQDKQNDCIRYERQLRDYVIEKEDIIKLREFVFIILLLESYGKRYKFIANGLFFSFSLEVLPTKNFVICSFTSACW